MATRNILAGMLTAAGLILAAPALAQTEAPAVAEAPAATEIPHQVLFIGNSYFYYNDSLHNHVRRMVAEGRGEDIDGFDYRSITISGGSLDMHPIAHYMTPGAIGYDAPFDLVVLQGNSNAAFTDKRIERFKTAVRAMDQAIRATGAKTALYMTHAYAEGHEEYAPDAIDKIDALYTEMGKEIGAPVIPVGLAFAEAKRQQPDLELQHDFDHSHPTLAGTYLASAVTYATLYGGDPVGLSYDYYGRLPADQIAFLQQVAKDTVAAYQAR